MSIHTALNIAWLAALLFIGIHPPSGRDERKISIPASTPQIRSSSTLNMPVSIASGR